MAEQRDASDVLFEVLTDVKTRTESDTLRMYLNRNDDIEFTFDKDDLWFTYQIPKRVFCKNEIDLMVLRVIKKFEEGNHD